MDKEEQPKKRYSLGVKIPPTKTRTTGSGGGQGGFSSSETLDDLVGIGSLDSYEDRSSGATVINVVVSSGSSDEGSNEDVCDGGRDPGDSEVSNGDIGEKCSIGGKSGKK